MSFQKMLLLGAKVKDGKGWPKCALAQMWRATKPSVG